MININKWFKVEKLKIIVVFVFIKLFLKILCLGFLLKLNGKFFKN